MNTLANKTYDNTASADFIHYLHNTDEAKDIAKALGLSQRGRHAVVIDIEPVILTEADALADLHGEPRLDNPGV